MNSTSSLSRLHQLGSNGNAMPIGAGPRAQEAREILLTYLASRMMPGATEALRIQAAQEELQGMTLSERTMLELEIGSKISNDLMHAYDYDPMKG